MKMKMVLILMVLSLFNVMAIDDNSLWGASGGDGVSTFAGVVDGETHVYSFGNAKKDIWYKGILYIFNGSIKVVECSIDWYTYQGYLFVKLVSVVNFDNEGNVISEIRSGETYKMPAALLYVEGKTYLMLGENYYMLM